MGKLVTLKFSQGSFESGFTVTLQIGDEKSHPSTEVNGLLPPNLDIPDHYSHWQSIYHNLISNNVILGRPQCLPKRPQPVVTVEECQQAAQDLINQLNGWLRAESFCKIREKWLVKLQPSDQLRVLLQTQDVLLQKLPWHMWDLLAQYPNAEIALSAPEYEKASQSLSPVENPKILAILGNSEGIDVESDRETLKQIADDNVQFLVEPALESLTDELWQQPWRILFFAGHSASQSTQVGRIFVNATESLTISQMKYALKASIQRGLQLAIFNSCDGLGLAREFADLHIPQLIVMREPVPDFVAQQFLKYFLKAFSDGKPLYQAVREARERLQGLEAKYPCATWLPIIWQNPSELPATWYDLMRVSGMKVSGGVNSGDRVKKTFSLHQLVCITGISTLVAMSVVALRFIGLFQSLELNAYDQFMRMRPSEPPDSRFLIITIDNEDIEWQQQQKELQGKAFSLSDRSLNRLLRILEKYRPRVIGLDIYRDFKAEDQELAYRLRQTSNLIGVCRGRAYSAQGLSPPPEIPDERIGFSNAALDPDGTVRRHLIFMDPDPGSQCDVADALSFQVVTRYLAVEGIQPTFQPDGSVWLGKAVFPRLKLHTGGYHAVDTSGSQILLNYRHTDTPFVQVSLRKILNDGIDSSAVKDRIVLIGVTDRDVNDYASTPYGKDPSEQLPGVVIHAHMISQMISTVKDQRSLLWTWLQSVDIIWISIWSLASGLSIWTLQYAQFFYKKQLTITISFIVIVSSCSFGISYIIFTMSGWVPLVPAVCSVIATASIVSIYLKSSSSN